MKKFLLSLALLAGVAGFSQSAQSVGAATSSKQIYITTSDKKVGSSIKTVPYNSTTKTYDLDANRRGGGNSTPPTPSGNSAVYHGETVPVYVSPRGKEFIYVTSKKTGNVYKKYIN